MDAQIVLDKTFKYNKTDVPADYNREIKEWINDNIKVYQFFTVEKNAKRTKLYISVKIFERIPA